MARGILAKLLAFKAGESGVVLYLVAILLVPFTVLAGVAVDVGQLLVVKNQLSAAIDAAALNIAANPSLTQAQAQAQARAFVNANFSTQNTAATLTSLTVTQTPASGTSPATVAITAQAQINTVFLPVINYKTLSTAVSTQVTAAQNYLEVVLVLDNTGSMASMYGSLTGIQGLQEAATTLVNTLFTNDPSGQYTKIGIVPFTAAVNVGTQYGNASWMDSAGAGPMTAENLNVAKDNNKGAGGLISLASELKNGSWGGCVRQRYEPYDIEDVSPAANTPNTLFTPYVAPDEPDSGGFINSYLSDGSFTKGTTQAQIQYDVTKYNSGTVSTTQSLKQGPNFTCAIQPIIRLTNNQQALLTEINAMTPYGATVIPAGLMWGWHLLSPNGPFADGVPYTNTTTIKAIILVTDGNNDVNGGTNGFNQSVYNAYGYGSGPHLNILQVPQGTNEAQPEYNLDQKQINLCNNIKAVKDNNGNPGRIQLYMIGFGNAVNGQGLQLLQQCATSSSTYFYNPTGDELISTFQSIAAGLNKLRISQ